MNIGQLRERRIDAIAIGASAGGVEALGVLLPALPARLRQPVFVVQHLPRDRKSLLVDIFAPRCARPLCEAGDKEPVEAGVVYFAPPDYHLLIDRGPCLALSADALVNYSRPSIDLLFESAADEYGPRLMAMVLSGANEDGAAGLAAVAAAGGVTVVQRPDDASVAIMPAAALQRVHADFVLPLADITGLFSALEH